eukprot:TRINITY_DN9783_c0_g1_i2.p1 TRINITY_DN9783_c0_g1~~TRINITY_DN9783_c0_g1_i2.p1  ORF type:complete len:425 (+),score=73.82 TRINITY_DN9783_c0_g1_i2:137-1411(+)
MCIRDRPLAVGAKGAASGGLSSHRSGCQCRLCFGAKQEARARRKARQTVGATPRPSFDTQMLPGFAPLTGRAGVGGSTQLPCGDLPRGIARPGSRSGCALSDPEEYSTVGERLLHIETAADVARLARSVELTRTAARHAMNNRSSRSHCLVQLHHSTRSGSKLIKRRFLLVDLAGSERILKTGVEGEHKKQATTINSSLTVLGRVVRALEHGEFVPFRESTLTMLLRGSFGGKSCTSVVINVAPEHLDETACSLEFGGRLTGVRNSATVELGQDCDGELRRLQGERERLRQVLDKMKQDGFGGRFGSTGCASERRAFTDNQRKMAFEESVFMESRSLLAEAMGSGASESELWALQARADTARFNAENLRMILLRQRSIEGFWIPPKNAYGKRLGQLKALEEQLKLAGGKALLCDTADAPSEGEA